MAARIARLTSYVGGKGCASCFYRVPSIKPQISISNHLFPSDGIKLSERIPIMYQKFSDPSFTFKRCKSQNKSTFNKVERIFFTFVVVLLVKCEKNGRLRLKW